MAVTTDPSKTGISETDALALTGTTLAPNVVNASLNSITPTGGALTVDGSISAGGTIKAYAGQFIAQESALPPGKRVSVSVVGDNYGDMYAFDATAVAAIPLVMQRLGGNVLIGSTTDNGSKLQVTGSISATETLFAGATPSGNSHILQKDLNGDYSVIVKNTNAVSPLGLRVLYEGIGSGNGNAFIGCQDNNGIRFVVGGDGSVSTASYIEGAEQTAPAAPAANRYRIFAQDNGAGKTQLMVIFATGAAQQIAIEP